MTTALDYMVVSPAQCLHPDFMFAAEERNMAAAKLTCQFPLNSLPAFPSSANSEIESYKQRAEVTQQNQRFGENIIMSAPWTSLEIISATYGTSIVTSKVHHLLTTSGHERFYFIPSNSHFGDPLPGTSKTFTLTWRLVTQHPPSENSQVARKTATNPVTTVGFEDYPFHLPYVDDSAPTPHQPLFAVSRDFYLLNATFCTVNVTSQIAEMIFWSRGPEVEIPSTADALCPGRDPAPELKKSLTVTYARRSSGDIEYKHLCQTAWQGETMILHIGPKSTGSPGRSPTPVSGSGTPAQKSLVKKFMVY